MTDSETIKANFPFPIILREPGLPTFQIVNEVYNKRKKNTALISSSLGGGANGLLGLGLSPATYHQITGSHFVRPNNPGALPQNVTGTAVAIGEQIRQHKEELCIFRQVENSDLALKSQLIDVFDKTYFRGLRNRHTGFDGVSYFRMIYHLYVNYGTITAIDLIENERRMDTPFDQSSAIETYFDQIEDAAKLAEAGASPFTMVQITTKAFIQMFTTGLFKDKYKAWNRLPPVARDWATFKLIFTAAARELQEMQAMSGTAGYANSVTANLMTQTSEALTTLT